MNDNHLIGPTLYDEYEQLYYCKFGLNDKKMTLLYTIWGKTPQEVSEKANDLKEAMLGL